MEAAEERREARALALIEAHCQSLDPAAPTARERLERMLGRELADMLVSALGGRPREHRAA